MGKSAQPLPKPRPVSLPALETNTDNTRLPLQAGGLQLPKSKPLRRASAKEREKSSALPERASTQTGSDIGADPRPLVRRRGSRGDEASVSSGASSSSTAHSAARQRHSVASSSQAPSPVPKDSVGFAVVVGVHSYDDPKIPWASHCGADAAEVAATLRRLQFEVILLTGTGANGDQGRPTLRQITSSLEYVRGRLSEQAQPVVVYVSACGAHARLDETRAADERGTPFALPADADGMDFRNRVLTTSRMKQVLPTAIIAFDCYPYVAGKNIVSPSGYCLVTGPPSIGGELRAGYTGKTTAVLTSYLSKGLDGYAVRDRKITSNALNTFISEKLQKRAVAFTTSAMRDNIGDVIVVPFVPKTIKVLKEERELKRFADRRFIANCIVPLELFASTELRLVQMTMQMRRMTNAKKRFTLAYHGLAAQQLVLIVRGTFSENLAALFDLALGVRRALLRAGCNIPVGDADEAMGQYTLISAGSVTPNSREFVAIGISITNSDRTVQKALDLWQSGKLQDLAPVPVHSCKLGCTLSLSGSLYDYLKLNKLWRLGLWHRWKFIVTGVSIDDPALFELHSAAVAVQRLWRGYVLRKTQNQVQTFEAKEKRSRERIAADWLSELYRLATFRDGGAVAVVLRQEADIRADMYEWEREERAFINTRMQRAVQRLESCARDAIAEPYILEMEELVSRGRVLREAVLAFRHLQLCRRLGLIQLKQYQDIFEQEYQERVSLGQRIRWEAPSSAFYTGKHAKAHALVISGYPESVVVGEPFTVTVHVVDRSCAQIKRVLPGEVRLEARGAVGPQWLITRDETAPSPEPVSQGALRPPRRQQEWKPPSEPESIASQLALDEQGCLAAVFVVRWMHNSPFALLASSPDLVDGASQRILITN
eukprot:TRINITY_DN4827_c0_g1_i1.p1 TRINITY_DN4827_c0_g1~~TRINITY_DN4827_c0_g1_i1.p1  ORF type:complete len:963 (-),score=135.41 TRINITY_DN4827_c0_g1_i1:32-2686(-)